MIRGRTWRLINLFPYLSAVTIVDDGPAHAPVGRMYELVWMGVIIDITLPSKRSKRFWSTGHFGPTWAFPRER